VGDIKGLAGVGFSKWIARVGWAVVHIKPRHPDRDETGVGRGTIGEPKAAPSRAGNTTYWEYSDPLEPSTVCSLSSWRTNTHPPLENLWRIPAKLPGHEIPIRPESPRPIAREETKATVLLDHASESPVQRGRQSHLGGADRGSSVERVRNAINAQLVVSAGLTIHGAVENRRLK